MNGLNEMDCDDLAEMAAELALGVLTGRERAQAIMHLDRCHTCRERIRDLAVTEEELLGLLPGREPPAGFETRVMGRLGFTGRHRRHPPGRGRWMLAAAAATIIVAAGLGGWEMRRAAPASPPAGSVAPPALHTIFLYGGRPGWLYMNVGTGSGNGTIICQLEGRDGSVITVGSFRLTGGYGHWGSPEPLPPATVTGARLATAGGKTLATASFSPRDDRPRSRNGNAVPAAAASALTRPGG